MKIVLACDDLAQKDFTTPLLGMLAKMYPRSSWVTYFHRPGYVGGVLEERNIQSAPLSRFPKLAPKLKFMLPSLSKNLFIDCDLLISVSKGFGHTFETRGKHICFLWGWSSLKGPWKHYLDNWRKEKLKNALIVTPTSALKNQLQLDCEVMRPFILHDKYPVTPMNPSGYYLICGGTFKERAKWGAYLKEKNLPGFFLGEGHQDFDNYLGNCSGDLYRILKDSKAIIDLSESYPVWAYRGLSLGRPFIAKNCDEHREYLNEKNGIFHSDLLEFEKSYSQFKLEDLHRNSQRFSEIRFRNQVAKFLNKD